jgi:hypothetical protein
VAYASFSRTVEVKIDDLKGELPAKGFGDVEQRGCPKLNLIYLMALRLTGRSWDLTYSRGPTDKPALDRRSIIGRDLRGFDS